MFRAICLFAAFSLVALPVAAVPYANVKQKCRVALSIALAPTAEAPVGATGSARIRIGTKHDIQIARVELRVSGLPIGTYAVDAALQDSTTVHLGSFAIEDGPTASTATKGDKEGIEMAIPAEVDALRIASLAIADANAVVFLTGQSESSTAFMRYFANVPVTGPSDTTRTREERAGRRIHGHALAHSLIVNDTERERHFLWVAFGAPPNTELTINVNGEPVGTVTSSEHGRVKFDELPGVELPMLKLIVLKDAADHIVMQAEF
jgi:hypothetical protein